GSVTDMERMFVDCASLEHVDLSGFDVRNVEEMAGMFSGCESLKSLDLSSFVPEQASDLSEMFSGCTSLTRVDLSNFHTGNVYTMEKMFESCESLTSLDLSAFDTGSVGVMDFMFWGCTSLASVDLSGFETPSLESMNYMFSRCSSLTKLDLSTFDTSNSYGIGMHGLISECTNLEYLDISSFDTSNGAGMDGMFGYNEYAEYEDEAITTPSLRTVVLGPKFTTWSSNCNNYHGVYSCELPSLANWTNGTVSLTTFELCEQYPSHAKEWAGVWRLEMPEGATRIYGSTRYKTSLQIADMLKEVRKIDKFGIVVLVDGVSFPDGLSASGLATMWRAPIITTNGASKKQYEAVNKYIRENLRENGWVYIIGGQNAIPDEAVASLSDYKCIRLAGNTRYQTNLEVLREIHDYSYGEILIANGQDFPDSLAASATGRPLLLVNGKTGKLTANQKEYLKECSKYNFTIIGGPTAISEELEAQIESIIGKPVDRVAGSTRYKTSTAIAGRFYPKAIRAVLGYGLNFPDALSAGPLAFVLKAPVILTASESSGAVKAARTYLQEKGIHYAYVMGGPKLIADKDVRSILGLGNDVEILVR
ncbi:MAG: BspA family leucine-rich repeat surface protein, partial [Lachnospiraceae bacterium]|nr:BspA family leucine-rich repeat surface protein [Lachnospiraceae bacterium]